MFWCGAAKSPPLFKGDGRETFLLCVKRSFFGFLLRIGAASYNYIKTGMGGVEGFIYSRGGLCLIIICKIVALHQR